MADIVSFVLGREQELLKKKISSKFLSVIFDGTLGLGEAMAIVVWYVDEEWNIQQRLISFKLLQKWMTVEETAQVVMDTSSREYSIPSDCRLVYTRDHATVNNVAVHFIKVLCFSHTLDLVGDKICIPTLSDFMLSWLSRFSYSAKAKMLWMEQTGRPIRSYWPTRWCMKQILELFPDVDTFLQTNDEFHLQLTQSWLHFWVIHTREHCLKWNWQPWSILGISLSLSHTNWRVTGRLYFSVTRMFRTHSKCEYSQFPNLNAVTKQPSAGNVMIAQ